MYRGDQVVEIRVHGVSGTPPEKVLGEEPLDPQVAGDDEARFFRRRSEVVASGRRPRTVEALHWGRFTSGSPSRALWLVMVPFALVNLARYTLLLPRAGNMSRAGTVADGVLRLLGLVLTLMLTATVAYVSLEVVVNQCLGKEACVRDNRWLAFLDGRGAGLPVLLGVVPLGLLIVMLWWFGRMSFLHDPPGEDGPWQRPTGDFGDPAFWHSSPKAPVLRAMHVAASCVLTGILAAGALDRVLSALLAVPGVLLLLVLAVVVVIGPDSEYVGDVNDPLRVPEPLRRLRWACVVYAVIAVGATVVLLWKVPPAGDRRLGFEVATNFLAVAALGSLVVLVVCCWSLKRSKTGKAFFTPPAPFRPMFRGYAAVVIAVVGTTLATGFSGGLAFWTANFIGKPVVDGEAPAEVVSCRCAEATIELSTSYWTAALLWGALLVALVLGLGGLLAWQRVKWRRDKLPEEVEGDYPGSAPSARTTGKVVNRWRWALLKYRYHWGLGMLALLGGALVAVNGVIVLIRMFPKWRSRPPFWLDGAFSTFGQLGAWVASATLAGLLFIGLRSWQGQKMRTAVGVVWDLIAFWPRLAHPICPPPYGGRTALLLKRRVEHLVSKDKVEVVVLSGHSQGSVVCTAVVRLIGPDRRSKVRLVTYGSQLQWAFARLFPTYMGYAEMKEMYAELRGRWRNIHRWTDPLGGPVLTWPASGAEPHPTISTWTLLAKGAHDIRFVDPVTVGGDEAVTPRSAMRGHSGYYLDPRFDDQVADLVEQPPAT
ncbi:hypothetical protein [Saccharothrix variisporea]|uniref:Integral membrane protein n=1 Tax=Saccharothrix variisporea TaxID=543527 RepID=A0A495XQ99_9PSEU|nr:hypothetical protein [Saccharothrix variisporea]RKT75056.1 hypothetical protein DFJ66_8433 [Saccharothrix variisporea]